MIKKQESGEIEKKGADLEVKIFMAGEQGTGKSTLLSAIVDGAIGGHFPNPEIKPTDELIQRGHMVAVEVGDIARVSVTALDAGGDHLKKYSKVMEDYYIGSRGGFI